MKTFTGHFSIDSTCLIHVQHQHGSLKIALPNKTLHPTTHSG
ncbi:hypothetical protein ACFPK9_00705 [Rubritalea spongiae]|uniref:Uncharacterized protein n=1 Tax=Rubritalea spongiae TaxID=430797 RepID=A0ABW5E5S9_9BACT